EATYDDSNLQSGLGRTRDELGRLAAESTTVFEKLANTMPQILSAGANAAATSLTRSMQTAATQAGGGLITSLTAALKALPGAIGPALGRGVIAAAGNAARQAGEFYA